MAAAWKQTAATPSDPPSFWAAPPVGLVVAGPSLAAVSAVEDPFDAALPAYSAAHLWTAAPEARRSLAEQVFAVAAVSVASDKLVAVAAAVESDAAVVAAPVSGRRIFAPVLPD